ncbi:MAG: hypothetical protein Q9187_001941, partial [Circinaria calcarea]
MLALGQSIAVLVVSRILQGMSAAVVWTIGLALLLDTVGSEKLGLVIGSIFGLISIGELAAPVLGGVVYAKAGYGGVFGMGFGLVGLDFLMRVLVIEKKTAKLYSLESRVDVDGDTADGHAPGEERETGRSDSHAHALQPPSSPSSCPKEESQWRIRASQPRWLRRLPILYCLSSPRLLVAQLAALLQATLLSTFDATLPIEAGALFGFGALQAGLLFVPLVAPYLLLGPVFGWLVDRHGTKPAAVWGFLWLIPPLILLRVPHGGEGGGGGSSTQIALFSVILGLVGVGLAAIGAPSIVEASSVCEAYFRHNPAFFGGERPYAQL